MKENNQQKNTKYAQTPFFWLSYAAWPLILLAALFFLISAGNSRATSVTTGSCVTEYGSWSDCDSTGTQTRDKITVCDGAEPQITKEVQTCSYAAYTICTFTYSDWSACKADGTQTRTVEKSPSDCQGGTQEPTVKSCTYTAPIANDNTVSSSSTDYSSSTDSSASSSDTTTTVSSSPSSSGSGSATSVNPTPKFTFSGLSDGMTLKGSFTIRGKVESAKRVELYLIPVGSNTPKFIGAGSNASGNDWQYVFNTTSVPNGSYYLRAAISNDYGPGPYESEKILININNFTGSAEADKKTVSTQAVLDGDTSGSLSENFNGATSPEWQERYFGSQNCADKNRCSYDADPDKDGLNNSDEFRYKTDPLKPDTDEDGFLDGDEIRNGFNPLKFSPGDRSDKIVFESPKEFGEINKDLYRVENVELVESDKEDKKELRLSGKGLPNSFVTIYIYSELPVILTVKTDADGNWSYVLDKQIDDGEHEVYVAITDNTGKITAKSEPLYFVKTAEAATVIPAAEASALEKSVAPAQKRRTRDLLVISAIIILGFILALTAIGFYIVHANKKTKESF